MKKLFNQMNKEEIKLIKQILESIKSTNRIAFTDHCKKRMLEKNITAKEIKEVFADYTIIESNYENKDLRVLIRAKNCYLEEVVISVSLLDGKIVTCFKNDFDDKHSTLNKEKYNSKMDIKWLYNRKSKKIEELGFDEILKNILSGKYYAYRKSAGLKNKITYNDGVSVRIGGNEMSIPNHFSRVDLTGKQTIYNPTTEDILATDWLLIKK